MQITPWAKDSYRQTLPVWAQTLSSKSNRTLHSTDSMVKYFSAEWMAQSDHDSALSRESRTEAAPSSRPHIPCMVQPCAPTLGKSQLQPKPKIFRPVMDLPSSRLTETCETASPPRPDVCASPISEASGYSSGYESEAASIEFPPVERSTVVGKLRPRHHLRSKFTAEQTSELEKIFSKTRYLEAELREKTAQTLHLTETQVKTWFQNRRMKLKREVPACLIPELHRRAIRSPYPSMPRRFPQNLVTGPALHPYPVTQLVLQPQMAPHRLTHQALHSHRFY
ncbi:homeobox protein pv.1-like [Xyrichtys novacula]|uniref:Homeobox protein pv.1-like n=1 Tax=Xyrichtys novacula TaxID=13765 RepID=A0AAV1G136_XYRNO|nr:homeobox protein pv.1-like [Xyrichtys novacula]